MKEAEASTMAAADLRLYLPVPGVGKWVQPRLDPESALGAATRHLATRMSGLAIDLSTTDSPVPSDVHCELLALSVLAASCQNHCRESLATLAGAHNRQSSNDVMIQMLATTTPMPTIHRYLAYDDYFNVVRVDSMTDQEMIGQVLVVAERLLGDLPNAFLARDVITSLLVGLAIMISGEGDLEEGDFAALRTEPRPDRAGPPRDHVYRWIVGHHVYFLATGYCRRFLDVGLDENGDGETRATQLGIAGSLLRATTGAMWYASELSPAAYLNHVRPSMPPDGFSGEHNSDHVLLRSSKATLMKVATSMAKSPDRPWEYAMLSNIERFLEIDLEDTEAHVLLAASKVGRHASLAQSAAVGEDELPQTTAVDMLRAIGKHKQSATAAFFRSQLKRRGYLHSGNRGWANGEEHP
jgi:hypothetical protein